MAKPPAEPTSSSYTVLARRYRPSRFEDCVGQEHVSQALQNAIKAGRVAHAYLFTGSRGVGKTSMARILAKALNCQNGPTPTPCGICEQCQSIAAGEDVDVLEIDGASNRGIDEVRDLRQGVNYRPVRSRFKIYIIDEVHMLTKEAFNALLKTLEEPPAHVKFLFATTEPQKIPITILSRCQRFDFAGIDREKIVQRLRDIVEAEGMSADDDALELVARRAAGSMRDSQSLLDQLLAFGSERLTVADVHQVLGTAGEERLTELVKALFERDAAGCLALVESAVKGGVQLGEAVDQLLDYFRDMLALSVTPDAPLLCASPRQRGELQTMASSVSPERMMEMMDLLAMCRMRMKSSTHGRTLLEMTLVRLCRLDHFLRVDEFVERAGSSPAAPVKAPTLARTAPAGIDSGPSTSRSAQSASAPTAEAPTAAALIESREATVADAAPAELAKKKGADEPSIHSCPLTTESAVAFWRQLVLHVGDAMLAHMLKGIERVRLEDDHVLILLIESKTTYSHCERSERIDALERLARTMAGRPVRIRLQLVEPSAEAVPRRTESQARDAAERSPLVMKAREALGAKLLDARFIDEGR